MQQAGLGAWPVTSQCPACQTPYSPIARESSVLSIAPFVLMRGGNVSVVCFLTERWLNMVHRTEVETLDCRVELPNNKGVGETSRLEGPCDSPGGRTNFSL